MNYKLFCQTYKPSSKQLYSKFFQQFKAEFKIKNERLAIEKLETILSTTFRLAGNQSFANINLRQLCQEAGISMGGFYAYFQSKEHLSCLINQFLSTHVFDIMDKIEKDRGCSTLRDFVKTHVYISDILQPWFFFVFMESKNLSKEHRRNAISAELEVEKRLITIIQTGQDKGVFKNNQTAEITAALIKPLFHEWYLKRWKYKRRNIKIDEYCENILYFITEGLKT